MKQVAFYFRVSSQGQADANGVDAQVHALDGWAKRNGVDPTRVLRFADEGVSGKSMERPEFARLGAAMERGEVGTVVCYDLSRAARNLAGLIEWVEGTTRLGVRVVFVKDNLDVDPQNPMSMLVLHVMGAFAEFERKRLVSRITDGLNARRAKGLPLGANAKACGVGRGRRRISLQDEAEMWTALGPSPKPKAVRAWLRGRGVDVPLRWCYGAIGRLKARPAHDAASPLPLSART